ncbi:MAG: hypothetical protein MHPDNHAH_02206 [Anaerolineales bacterium]|nr:hypothetical protein [Anaerolineales bacterium]WKZ47615.1 MAG: hypothetical protein QY306_17535 [Anaerolineales bacterium]
MPAKKQSNKKLKRVQFSKESTAEMIVSHIRRVQDEWALKNPEKAHRLYPKVFDETGKRIGPEDYDETEKRIKPKVRKTKKK